MRRMTLALIAPLLAVGAGAVPARAQAPEFVPGFSERNILVGQSFTVSGTLPRAAADAGRTVTLYERRAPFATGKYAVAQTVPAGADGSYSFGVTPVRKAYWSVAAEAGGGAPREASRGYLVALRRKISIRVSDRTPRRGATVRFSGFVAPTYPTGPSSVATLQRRDRSGAFANLKTALVKNAGAFSSYRITTHVGRAGTYRVYIPSSTYFSQGASAPVVVRVHR